MTHDAGNCCEVLQLQSLSSRQELFLSRSLVLLTCKQLPLIKIFFEVFTCLIRNNLANFQNLPPCIKQRKQVPVTSSMWVPCGQRPINRDLKKNDDDGCENIGKKMNLRSFKLHRSICQMQATFSGGEFLRILFRLKKMKENSSSYVHVLHKASN